MTKSKTTHNDTGLPSALVAAHKSAPAKKVKVAAAKKTAIDPAQISPETVKAPDETGSTKQAPGILKRSSSYFADPSCITRKPGFNPRFDFGEIEELAKSIKANGLLQPLRIKRLVGEEITQLGKLFVLIDGDRRLTAIELLIKKGHEFPEGVPAVIVDKDQTELTSLIQMFEANTGKAFLPLEEAAAYKRMKDAGMTVAKICASVGRKQVHVISSLALLEADGELQTAVKDKSINSTTAKKIAVHARGDKAKQKELVAQAKAVGKDKGKKKELDKAIDDSRRSKAAKTGKVLKMRALSDDELSNLGSGLAAKMADRMKEAGKSLDFDVRGWVAKDEALALAFTFGALEALKAAAGVKIDLDI